MYSRCYGTNLPKKRTEFLRFTACFRDLRLRFCRLKRRFVGAYLPLLPYGRCRSRDGDLQCAPRVGSVHWHDNLKLNTFFLDRAMRPPFVLFVALNVVQAFNLPFFGDLFRSGQTTAVSSEVVPLKIAIIGAGAGGSTAAFWIAKAQQSLGVHIEVDVYERSDYIGGRAYCMPSTGKLSPTASNRQHHCLSL